MSGSVAIVDSIEKTLSLSDRTKSLDAVLINENNRSSKWTNSEVNRTSESASFRIRDLFLPNGDSYSGSLLGKIPEGSGKYVWSDGSRYEGEWRHGMRHGHGKLEWPTGAVYDGEFSGGYMHGEGMHIAPDKVTYRGRWRFNLKHGLGYQVYPNGDFFEGSWIRGTPEGPGKYKWANGNVYVGNMKRGTLSGKGTLTWINGDSYEGSWLNGMMHGPGAYTWRDGGCYIGTWTHGLKDGKGTFYPSGSRLTAGQEFYLNALRKQGLLPDLRKQKRVSHISHSSSVDTGNVKVSGNKGSSRYSYDRLSKGDISNLEQSHPINVTLERRWSLEVAIEKVIGNDLDGVDTGNDMNTPILEREYMQGVLISEVVLNDRFSPARTEAKRRQSKLVRESKRPGEAIIKGHRRYNVMLSLQLGIRYSVGKVTPGQRREVGASDFGACACSRMYFPKKGSQLTPSHQSEDFKWKDYRPVVFRNLRELFKIDTADYMMSICGNDALRELSSPGKSGSVFFLSQDDRFMIKTLRKSEVKVLLRMLPNYHRHVKAYENTLITKFFGLHMIKSSRGQMLRFVVMGNMFCTELRIHRRFDLKGSSLGRSANKVEIDENTILKDLDLNYCFYLEPSWREALLKQIEIDSKFLEQQHIMDYSLLLGVHYRAPQHLRSPISCSGCTTTEGLGIVADDESLEDEILPQGLVLVPRGADDNCVVVGSHVRGRRLRTSSATGGDKEVDLLLPGTARLQIQLGVNMPARADHIPGKGFYCIFLGGARESKFFIDQGRKRIGSSTAMQNSSSYDLSFKILLIGDSGVGKSSLLLSFISNAVDDVTPTIGVDFKIKTLTVGGKRLKLTIWDTAGQEKFRTLTSSYFRGAQGIILVYDVTRRDTFTNLSDVWAKEVELYCTNEDCVKMLVGNKVDRESERVVRREEGVALAKELGSLFLECSAKTRANVEQCFEELTLKPLKYKIKKIPTHPIRFAVNFNNNFLKDFEKYVGDNVIQMFKDTIFGPFLDISKCNFQGQITKCLLLLELEQSNPNMFHIRHSNGCVLKFGIDDFALLTGLKVRGNTNDFKYPEQTNCMLFKKYFPGAVNSVTKHQLVQRFKMGNWESNQDALQMSILFFIHTFVLASIDNTAISIVDFLMVEDGRYQHFPWGQLSFSKLIGSLRQDFDVSKKLYRLYGMPYALNVWIYECASNLNSEIAVRERNVIPRICNWRVVSEKAKFEMLMSTIFQKNACSNIVPTAEEIEAFDIAQVEHAHSTSIPLVQPNEQDDLDDFSTKPPEQLLRTYSRVSDTSPPPPPKRRKKSIIQKKKVSEQKQPDQSNVSPTPDDDVHVSMSSLPQHSNADDVHGSVPQVSPKSAADVHGSVPDVSQNPAADVHGYADSQNVNNIIPHIEELKGYLKTYVDKKFEELIILIKANHSQLMQSISKENINFQADTSTFQSDKQTSQQIPVDLDDMGGVAEDGGGFSGKNGEHHIVDDAGDVDVDGVGVAVNEGEPIVTDPKDGDAHQSHQDLNEHIMDQPVDDNVHHNIPHVLPEKTTTDSSDSSTSTTISPSTQAAIEALIKDLGKDATNARPLYSYDPKNITSSQYLLTDSQLPTEIPITGIAVKTDAVTPAHRNRMPSRRIQSPYCTSLGSSEKGKEKLKDMARLHFPFEGCGIADKVSPKLIEDYMNWLLRGLLKNHNNKNPSDDKYRSRSSSFGFTMMDFVVAFPMNKNWFYAMSQPNKCWSDEHIDVIFYYLRKKSKLCSMDQYRYTTTHCLFMSHVKNCYDRYYMDDDDDSLTTQEHIDRASVVSVHERSIINIIKGFGIPAALPWHLVDEVYIPINCDQQFHWVLAVVELKNRLIRVFDSSISTRKQTIPHEIKMLSKMLPSYLLDSGFFEENERTNFADCQAYKDNNNGSLLEPQVPFMIEFAQDIPTQESDSLDCGLYVTAFAEYISDQINISYADFNPDYLRQRYGALLWSYGIEKAKCGYVSDNDDPPKSRGVVTPPPEEDLVHIA